MGITDRFKLGSSGNKSKSDQTKAEPETNNQNVSGEGCSQIPQMVVTSSEGVLEDVTIDNCAATIDQGLNGHCSPPNGKVEDTPGQVVQCPIVVPEVDITLAEETDTTVTTPEIVVEEAQDPEDQRILETERPPVTEINASSTSANEGLYEVVQPMNRLIDHNGGPSTNETINTEKTTTSFKENEGILAKTKAFLKHDGKPLFTFPKFSFSHKDHKKPHSPKTPEKDDTGDKTIAQEYDLEAALSSNKEDAIVESYRPLSDDGFSDVPLNDEDNKKTPIPIAAEEDPKINKFTSRSSMIHPPTPHETNKQSKSKKEEKTRKANQDDIGAEALMNGNRENSPDTLYDTCCIRLALLLKNKALELPTPFSPKPFPPKKPPKPSQEALATARAAVAAKKLKEYQSLEHHFGDDIPVGVNGIRYADDDTESSTDYKDLENFGVIMNPECYGIFRNTDGKTDSFRAPSTCSGMTSYYTADTATLKDENSSDNTLETVSLGSYESVVCRPLSLVSDDKSEPLSLPDEKTLSEATAKVKKIPPPIPPKPAILLKSIKTPMSEDSSSRLPESSQEDISRCINNLSLSPRPVTKSSNAGIRKRPLTIAGVKETEFPHYSRGRLRDKTQRKPVLSTVVQNKSLKTMRNLPLEPTGFKAALNFPARHKENTSKVADDATAEVTEPVKTTKPLPPPRPPLPTTLPHAMKNKTKEDKVAEAPKELDSVPKKVILPTRSLQRITHVKQTPSPRRPIPPLKPVTLPRAKVASPPRPPPPVFRTSSIKQQTTIKVKEQNGKTPVSNGAQPATVASNQNTRLDEKPEGFLSEENELLSYESIFEHSLETCDIGPEKEITDVETVFKQTCDDTNQPTRPPRVRSKRSRTVEVSPRNKREIERKRRSQSLSDIDIKSKLVSRDANSTDRTELKVLYTKVNKATTKLNTNNLEKDFNDAQANSEDISARPLPAPPRPPRSKSRSSTRRTKSDERPRLIQQFDSNGLTRTESLPNEINSESIDIKPPARRKNKETKFFSLDSKEQAVKKNIYHKRTFNSLRHFKDGDTPPIKPERRFRHGHALHYDENANVADPLPRPSRIDHLGSKPSVDDSLRPRVKSMGVNESKFDIPPDEILSSKLKRSQSENIHTVSHSRWYDKTDEVDGLDLGSSFNQDTCDGTKYHTVIPIPRSKRRPQASKFYVEVEEEDHFEDSISHPPTSDKETSPLPLECFEKSVQTSLETLSHAASRGELSENSNDLLDLAQTLQDELKTIISRHNTKDDKCGDTSSDHASTPPLKKMSTKQKLPTSSTSSTSELWQISSSEESEDEHRIQADTNLSEMLLAKKKNKIFYIAQEIMSSEDVFVDALKLMNVDFRTFVDDASKQRAAPVIPDDILNQILNHLPQLQHLNDNLLMELKDRIENWDTVNKIADVIVKMGPFLKLYSWYIQDFESAMSLLEESKKKFPVFAQLIKEFEASPRCKRLSLNHYMLKPVQRIPQYRLLLQEYLHRLTSESADYEDTIEALRIVSDVAKHANESMKQGDNFQKLMSIQSSILGHKEIIKPGRLFVKEGELMKLSRRGMQSRWFVLLSDLLLYLTPVQQGLYRVNHELELVGMKVAIPIQQDYQNEFSIISVTRSFSLAAKSPEERQEWIVALTKAIEENVSKRSTFNAVRLQQQSQHAAKSSEDDGFVLGKKAPVWIPDARVTMCQLCTSEFTVTFRRHHCRACGKVCCSICSSNRISLQYLGNRIARVCDECYTKLGQGSSGCTESGETDSDNQQIALKSHLRTDRHPKKTKRQLPSVLKEVCANDQGSTLSGYIHKKVNKSWKRNWFVIKDKILYEYRASEDVAALRSLPLLGFQINCFDEPYEGFDAALVFEISHKGQSPIIFRADTTSSAKRWIKELKESTVLE